MTNWRDTIMTHTEMCDKLDELTKESDALALRLDRETRRADGEYQRAEAYKYRATEIARRFESGVESPFLGQMAAHEEIQRLRSRLDAARSAVLQHMMMRGFAEVIANGYLDDWFGAVEKGETWKCGECGQEFGEQIDLALHMSAKHRV